MHKIPNPIQWHEGMLLMPQHFQQMAGRYESLVQYMTTIFNPYPWGVLKFEYDRTALAAGRVCVTRIEAVMRDGLLVSAGSAIAGELELNLKSLGDQMRAGPLTVHLVVPAQHSLSSRGELARYESYEGDAVIDESSGDGEIHIPRLRSKVALWAGGTPPARFESIPLMTVAQQGEAYLEAAFVAPALTLAADSSLGQACGSAFGLVRERMYFLAEQLQSGLLSDGDPEANETRSRIHCLAGGLLPVEAILQCNRAHPFQMYLALCQFAGHLAGITFGLVPPHFAPYRHDDLRATFQPLLDFITQSVSEAIVEAWRSYPFRMVDGVFQVGSLAAIDEALAGEGTLDRPLLAMALRPVSGTPLEQIVRWGESCVIGSAGVVPSLLANRVLGFERRPVDRLPDLSPPRGAALFAITADSSAARKGEPLQLVERFSEQGPVEAVLYVRRSREGRLTG
jgi:type VI secretion system protein ImpJ